MIEELESILSRLTKYLTDYAEVLDEKHLYRELSECEDNMEAVVATLKEEQEEVKP